MLISWRFGSRGWLDLCSPLRPVSFLNILNCEGHEINHATYHQSPFAPWARAQLGRGIGDCILVVNNVVLHVLHNFCSSVRLEKKFDGSKSAFLAYTIILPWDERKALDFVRYVKTRLLCLGSEILCPCNSRVGWTMTANVR